MLVPSWGESWRRGRFNTSQCESHLNAQKPFLSITVSLLGDLVLAESLHPEVATVPTTICRKSQKST